MLIIVSIIFIVIGWNNLVLMFLKLNSGKNIVRIIKEVKKIGCVIFLVVIVISLVGGLCWLCFIFKCLNIFFIIIIELFISMLMVIVIFFNDIKLVDKLSYVIIFNVKLIEIGIDSNIKNVVFKFNKNSVNIMIINIKVKSSVLIIVCIVWLISFVWL